jgi:hypothetical protein
VSAITLVLPLLFVFGFLGNTLIDRLDHIFNPAPFYSQHLGSIRILESQMNWVQTTDGPRIYLTGIVTNRSLVPWKDVEFECRLFGGDGRLVDAANGRSYFTIEPGNDSAFRVSLKPGLASNEYRSFKISVNSARNGKSRF